MDNITYLMATEQQRVMRDLEVAANNSANVNTKGYKADKNIFSSYMKRDVNEKIAFGRTDYTNTNFEEGSYQFTGRAFDVAINGEGFFIVRTPNGERYTRDGRLKLNEQGVLVNSSNLPILTNDGQEIVFEEGDEDPVIGSNGNIFVGENLRGQIGVVEFANKLEVRKTGSGLFMTNQAPIIPENFQVAQGILEESNVNPIRETTKMIELNRQMSQASNMLQEKFNMQRNAFKTYSKISGAN